MPFRRRAFVLSAALTAICVVSLQSAFGDAAPGDVPRGPPRIDDVTPSVGMGSGGERVTVEGENFTPPMKVWLGHASCGGVRIRSSYELECITSPHSAGSVDLMVKTPRAFFLHRKAFTYVPAFQLTPSPIAVATGTKTTLHVSGGVPPYRFSIPQGTSVIDEKSGVLNGAGSPEVGVVRVTDSDGHTTETGYDVVFPLQVFPQSPQIAVDHSLTLTAYGGLPPYQYQLVSGPGRFVPERRSFVASSSPGKTVIRITDAAQESQDVAIIVNGLPPIPPHLIAAGDGFSCAAPAGAVNCWGSNGSQQLGQASVTFRSKSEDVSTPVASLQAGVASIVSGMHHTCVLIAGGVRCWGGNEYGQLGDGTTEESASPRQVIGLESGVLAIAAGDFHTCAVLANSAVCWGRNDGGQLGDGTSTQSSVPVAVESLEGTITAIGAGASHTCAVLNGIAKCWGSNRNGELGDGDRIDRWSAVHVDGLGSGVLAISAGRGHTCAATATALKCWGFNGTGNLGASTAADKLRPYDVRIQAPVSVLASRQYHSCGIVSGSLYCWGYNYQGELGDSSYLNRWAPTLVSGFKGPVRDVATANYHSCAVLADNQVYCWGDDYFGELGDGGHTRQSAPVRVITEAEKIRMRRKAPAPAPAMPHLYDRSGKTVEGDSLQ